MNLTNQIAKHFRDVHFGGNWTWSNLKDHLADVTWQEATTQVYDLNTIAVLTYHIHYFVAAALDVLQGRPMTAHDKYSFTHPPINSAKDWDKLCEKVFTDAETFTTLIEQLPESKLRETFVEEKYGSYYRNIQGIIEHTHYHLGQLVLIKKIVRQKTNNPAPVQSPGEVS